MKSKIISSILISSLLIQISLTSGGCMTFSPVDDNNLANHKKDGNTLLIKLKDKRNIEVKPENLIYFGNDSLFIYGKGYELNLADTAKRRLTHFNGLIFPANIDSENVFIYDSTKFYLFWMNNNKRISIRKDNLARFNSNTMDNYWVAKSEDMGYQQFYEKDITVIEEKGPNKEAKIIGITAGVIGFAALIYVFVSMLNTRRPEIHIKPIF